MKLIENARKLIGFVSDGITYVDSKVIMTKVFIFIVACAFLTGFHSQASVCNDLSSVQRAAIDNIVEKEFGNITWVMRKLLKKYPPAKTLIVGLGRSPTPLIAGFQALNAGFAIHLPMSFWQNGVFRPALSNQVDEIFKHFLKDPGYLDLEQKTLLLLDWTDKGTSLAQGYQLLVQYLNKNAISMKVVPVALLGKAAHNKNYNRVKETMKNLPVDFFELDDYVDRSFVDSTFDRFSEFDSFPAYDVGARAQELQPRAEYAYLKKQFLKELTASREDWSRYWND